ncbi:MAG: gliding motility-associated C-terminal domain-containing protein [Bacteroidia bacterium]|nr:gliding motility-associated C-terminal domain-containing protein [Bacteroidia bacterium]
MKKALQLLLLTGTFVLPVSVFAQNDSCCANAGFERTNTSSQSIFSPWQGCTGSGSTVQPWACTFPGLANIGTTWPADSGVNLPTATGSFVFQTGNGIDPNIGGNNCMTVVAPGGGSVSVRLGNSSVSNKAARMMYQINTVDSCNAGFTYSYAVVLQDPSHTPQEQPRFDIKVTDINGNILGGPCGTYSVYAGSDPNFQTFGGVKYLCWVTVGIDLLPYIGTTVRIEYATMDCTQGGHYGYAYIDCGCSPLMGTALFCPNSNGPIVLIAPSGYASYQWNDPFGNPIPGPGGTNDTCIYTLPAQIGDQFVVGMVSAAGCTTNLTVTLVPTIIQATTTWTNAICYGGIGIVNTTPSGGTPIPTWNVSYTEIVTGQQLGGGSWNTGTWTDTLYAGTYVVTFQDSIGCEHKDTITITQPPSPPDTLPQTMYFCEGDSIGYFMYQVGSGQNGPFQWFNYPSGTPATPLMPTNQVWLVPNPTMGSTYWFTWYDNNGCKRRSVVSTGFQAPNPLYGPSDTVVNIFTPNGDNMNETFRPYFSLYWTKEDIEYYAKEYNLKIYSRWGNLIFETDDYMTAWDGKKGSAKVNEGVYYWVATYKNRCAPEDEPPIEKAGYVHLMK